jgi:hypothetical protein
MIDKITRKDIYKTAFDDAPTAGYVVECGVQRGVTARKLISFASENHKIFGFDSFDGLPEDWVMSDEFTWRKGSFACEIPDIDGMEIYAGLFADTLPTWKCEHTGNIAVLHIDCDLYSSTRTVLEELNDQIVQGTVIISDDHFDYDPADRRDGRAYTNWEQGQYKAFNEWLEKYNRKAHMLLRGTLGQAAFRITQ